MPKTTPAKKAVKKSTVPKTKVKKEAGLAKAAGYESSEDARIRLEKEKAKK